jgi:hypothetical protein
LCAHDPTYRAQELTQSVFCCFIKTMIQPVRISLVLDYLRPCLDGLRLVSHG